MTDIEDILAKLNPKTAATFRKASESRLELLPTPSLGINMAMNGIGYGRFTVLYGNRGSGKSTFAYQLVAEAQKQGKVAAWIDVEKNFSETWARRLGADPDKILLDDKTISIAGMADKAKDAILSGVDVLVVDSISQLLPQSFFEDTTAGKGQGEIKDLHQTGQIGTFSKNMGQAINIMNGVNDKTAIILISQVRNNIGSYGASKTFMGGLALEHAASTVLKFWRTPSDIIEKNVKIGDLILKRPVGAPVTWTIEKNRGPGMNMSNKYNLYTGGDNVGIDLCGEIVTYAVEFGVIKKGGAWYTLGENKFQGEEKMVDYLRENPDIQEKVYLEVMEKSAL